MSGTEIKVPSLGESITEAIIGQWFKSEGDRIDRDEPLVELETDKVTVEVPAPEAGVLAKITAKPGETVEVGSVIGQISPQSEADSASSGDPAKQDQLPQAAQHDTQPQPEPAITVASPSPVSPAARTLSPAVNRMVTESGLDAAAIQASGPKGNILKSDVQAALAEQEAAQAAMPAEPEPRPYPQPAMPSQANHVPSQSDAPQKSESEREERVPLSRLRQTIARRLKAAQNTAAMLTTFNEVDMHNVMRLRREYQTLFQQKYGVKLGLMSFFVKAVVQALRDIPNVNAELDDHKNEIVYKNYYHIGIAVGSDRGLVVPVLRDADQLTLAGIELAIKDFASRAQSGKLTLPELSGGTFTISNGGVYGSLMSTPILNPPQSGILGMHKIQDRPVVVDGEIKVRPMMYLALSYDHRLVDGKEAVMFLVRVKESIEAPERLMLDL